MAIRRMDLIITSNAQAALRGFASLEGAAKRVENRFGKAGRAMFNLGVIGAGATAAFTAKSVKAFIEFDDAMVRSTAILDNISGPVRKRLEDAAKAIARTTTFSATEAAEAYYGLFSAGLDAEQSISAIPVVAQFAQAGLMDLATATDFLVNSQAALGMTMEDPIANMKEMQRVADVLTETNNLATGTVEEFADALTHKAGGALKTVGKDIEEGAAALAYLAEQGVRGSRAGESLAIFIRDVSRAAGNPSFKGAFRDFGIEVFNAEGNLKNLADVVAEFETALGPMSDKQRAVTLEQLGLTRSVGDVIRQFMGGSEAIRGYEFALRGAGGATQTVADKQMESLKAKLEVIKNRLEVLMIEFGEPVAIWLIETFFPWFELKFMPAMKDLGALVREDLRPAFDLMAKALDNPTVVKFLAAVAGFVAVMVGGSKVVKMVTTALGPLLAIVRLLVAGFGHVKFAFFAIKYAIVTVVIPALQALAAAIGISLGWLILIIIAVIAVAVAIYIWRDEIWEAIKAVGRFFVRLWEMIYDGFVGPIIRFFTGPFIDFWVAVWEAVRGPLNVFLTVLKVILNVIIVVVFGKLIVLTGIVVAIVTAIVRFFITHWETISSFIAAVWRSIVVLTKVVWNDTIWPALRTVWDLIFNLVVLRLKLLVLQIRTSFNIAKTIITVAFNVIKAVLLASWHFIRDRIIKPLGMIWELFVLPKLKQYWEAVKTIWDGISAVFEAAWHFIRDRVLKPAGNFWEDTLQPKIAAFALWISLVWGSIKSNTASIWRSIVNAVKTPVNAIIRVINALISGINTVIGLINKIPGVDIPEIPKIPLIGGGGGGGAPVAQDLNINPGMAGVTHATGTYDLHKRGPFKTSGIRAIVGEGDPRFAEYVIPTDPRHRNRAHGLFAALADDLGMGFQLGGIIDSVKGGIGDVIDAAGGFVEDLARGALKTAFSPFNDAAKAGLNLIPNAFRMRSIAQGFREMIWQVIQGADAGFPEEAPGVGSAAGLVGFAAEAFHVFRKMFPGMTIGGWRAKGSVPGSDHPKGKALDLMTTNPVIANIIIARFLAMAGRKYWIWNRMIGNRPDFNPRHYSGPSPHTDHVHLSFLGAGGLVPLANGLARVPFDNFPANLHKDEMVLDANRADSVRNGGGMGNTYLHIGQLHFHVNGADSVEEVRRKQRAATKAFMDVIEERKVLTDARIS